MVKYIKSSQNLPSFPEEINKDLTNSLKEIKKIIDKKHSYLNLVKLFNFSIKSINQ